MDRPVKRTLALGLGLLAAGRAEAQTCAGVGYYEACLDAIAGRPAKPRTTSPPSSG